jgi:hypothetical protein
MSSTAPSLMRLLDNIALQSYYLATTKVYSRRFKHMGSKGRHNVKKPKQEKAKKQEVKKKKVSA